MAKWVSVAASVLFLAVLTWLQPCSGLPVDRRVQKLRRWERESQEPDLSSDGLCFLCEGAVSIIQDYLEENTSIDALFPIVQPFCVLFMNRTNHYNGPYMCPGFIHSYGPVILYVIAEGSLKPSDFCHLLHLCNTTSSPLARANLPALHSVEQSIGTLDGHGVVTGEGVGMFSTQKTKKKPDTVVFLQISDIHLDTQYSEGSPSLCNLYMCCRSWYNGTGPAGLYGNYNCDLPLVTLDLLVEAVTELDPQPDFIIYTGDNSPHDVWNETWASQFQASQYVVSYLSQKLPNRLIYPAIGNHETWPESEYMATLPQYQELTKKLAQYWQSLVPLPQSALDTIAEGGYYTLLIQDRLRLLAFNSDYGYSLNFYTALNSINPHYSKQQLWITDTLQQATAAGEKVIMIGHIPPGFDTLQTYEEFYLNLTKQYRDTIVGHLFGHTHHDEFKLVQDEGGVYGTVLLCPSVTPFGRSNPSFRMFTMDASSYQLLGYQQFHLNLTLANELASKGVKPKFELAYTTTDLYNLDDLSPASWAGLVERFGDYPDLVSQYRYNVYGRSSSHDLSCDAQCVHETICSVSSIVTADQSKCSAG